MEKTFAVVAALTLTFNFAEAQNTRRGQFNPEMLKRLDRDGDGRISKSEAPGRMGERFGMIDSNGDGFLDQEEQAKLISMMQRGAAVQSAGKSTGRSQGMAPRAQAGGLMAVIDKDGDGELSEREISQAAAALRKLIATVTAASLVPNSVEVQPAELDPSLAVRRVRCFPASIVMAMARSVVTRPPAN